MRPSTVFLLILLSGGHIYGQTTEEKSWKYLGQKIPGTTPVKFAPDFLAAAVQHEFGSVFSRDGQEFYYGVDTGGKAEIRFAKLSGGQWTKPAILLSHEIFSYNDPMLNPDENRLYFISDQPLNKTGEKKDYDIWFVERTENGWSAPVNAGSPVNSSGNEYYISFAENGTMFFSSNRSINNDRQESYDIYAAAVTEFGVFGEPHSVGDSINTHHYEADVFVAPDESYMIFCGDRPDGFGKGDLYISFRKHDGNWTKAKNMGEKINTSGHELCPFVTRDGRHFFYTSSQDIYWVDAGIIDDLKKEFGK
jgi:hypothetical protein